MANLLFIRGLHQNLPVNSAVDGAFYLTTDTHRLYAGINSSDTGKTELVDLNQYIQVVSTTQELYSLKSVEPGDFAYVETGNILAIYKYVGKPELDYDWVQINPNTDTKVKQVGVSNYVVNGGTISGTRDSSTLSFSVYLDDSSNTILSDFAKFVGKGGTKVEVNSEGQVTITGCTYSLGGTFDNDVGSTQLYTVTLNPNMNDVDASSITLKAGSNIEFTNSTDEQLVINAKDTTLAKAGHSFTTGGKGQATLTLSDSQGTSYVIQTGENAFSYSYGKLGGKTANNLGKLDVYTIEEVDELFSQLNPMKYMGVVVDASQLPGVGEVKIGDTYMASNAFPMSDIPGLTGKGSCKVGDLFIATGTEQSGVIISGLKWTYVPSGDDVSTDTVYSGTVDAAGKKWLVTSSAGNGLIGETFEQGDNIDITASEYFLNGNSGAKGLKVKIGHGTPGTTDASKATKKTTPGAAAYTFDAVSTVNADVNGHVSGYTVQRFKIPKAGLASAAVVSVKNQIATVAHTLNDDVGNSSTAQFKIDVSANDNLNVTASGDTVTFSLEWGTF